METNPIVDHTHVSLSHLYLLSRMRLCPSVLVPTAAGIWALKLYRISLFQAWNIVSVPADFTVARNGSPTPPVCMFSSAAPPTGDMR